MTGLETGSGPEVESDEAFCQRLLPQVSRTFALSIELLPESLREAVRVGYLLCRVVDSIEDEADLSPRVRIELFDAFDAAMEDDLAPTAAFEALSAALVNASIAESELCARAGAVFRRFRALSEGQRRAIRPHVLEMSAGMREYAVRADRDGRLRICDVADLERYCYFVAGTVGHLLTELFVDDVPGLPLAVRAAVRSRATSFGLGLQMVNIVKDVAEDLPRGVCFLPEEALERNGVTVDGLLEPEQRAGGLAVIGEVCARARDHLIRAQGYTLAWPADRGMEIRLFCAVPLAFALATLREVEHGEDSLRDGRNPKISREQVAAIFGGATEAVKSDEALRALFAAQT
jgi:farnesyl-diphosphate farnesyltransferase